MRGRADSRRTQSRHRIMTRRRPQVSGYTAVCACATRDRLANPNKRKDPDVEPATTATPSVDRVSHDANGQPGTASAGKFRNEKLFRLAGCRFGTLCAAVSPDSALAATTDAAPRKCEHSKPSLGFADLSRRWWGVLLDRDRRRIPARLKLVAGGSLSRV
jgi:hypothetical protein